MRTVTVFSDKELAAAAVAREALKGLLARTVELAKACEDAAAAVDALQEQMGEQIEEAKA